jgi:hypothetical protein
VENETQSESPENAMARAIRALASQCVSQGPLDEQAVRTLAREEALSVQASMPKTVIEIHDGPVVRTVDGAHVALASILELYNAGIRNVALVGPAGSGKTSLGLALAEALDAPCALVSMGPGSTEADLAGRLVPLADGTFSFIRAEAREIYGLDRGVIILDELDGSDPSMLLTLNAMLANKRWHYSRDLTGSTVKRGEGVIIIACLNTWGNGPTAQYVGRAPLDAATIDRFTGGKLFVSYDENLEKNLASSEVVAWVHALRRKIESHSLRRIVSTRAVVAAGQLHAAGWSLEKIAIHMLVDWTTDERNKIGSSVYGETY